MLHPESLLKLVLRIGGAFCVLALVGVFMPMDWMDRTHRWMGLGPLPAAPIVEWLARALSAWYAIVGGLLILLAGDTRTYARVITYVAVTWLAMVVIMLIYGLGMEGMALWVLLDAATMVPFGGAILILQYLARRHSGAEA